jgi:hypothetical protein
LYQAGIPRRIRRAGIDIAMKRLLRELGGIREVIHAYPRKRGQRAARRQTVLSKRHELQDRRLSILALPRPEEHVLA